MCGTSAPSTTSSAVSLPVTEKNSSGCSCCAPQEAAAPTAPITSDDVSAAFPVLGLTCGSCASRVSGAVGKITGVREARVDLVAGGISTLHVTSSEPLDAGLVASAVTDAGYQLASS
jgi:copper chaperone